MAQDFAMKRKHFSVEQMVAVLKQAELALPGAELTRQAQYRPFRSGREIGASPVGKNFV